VIPKAELHVHLEATMPPALVRELARRNRVEVATGVMDGDRFAWRDFLHFLELYDEMVRVIQTPQDYRDIAYDYLVRCAAEGAIYVELTASPDHAQTAGVGDDDHVAALAQAIDDARADCGIEARIVMTCVRHYGVERAVELARRVVAHPHRYVTGFGMAGDEAGHPPGPFAKAFLIAHEAGLGVTVHAGEWAGPESIRGALALPVPVTRLGHGVRAIEDPALVEELAERGTVLEVCPTSNVVLGVFGSYAEHPWGRLRAAGVRVTLGSDDPPWWGATIGGEYRVAHEELATGADELVGVTRTAIEAAFIDEEARAGLLRRLPAG